MDRMTSRLRALLAAPGVLVAPACFDAFTARIAARAGFPCVALGGYALGAHTAVTEPLLSMTETVDAARRITALLDVPLVVDAGTGYGEPLHVMRTVREMERAGVAAIHLEDQAFPKRAHYHREYREHVVSAEEMVAKLRFARQARTDPDFVLIARTDAMQTAGYAEGIRRAVLYAEAGADMIMCFPNTDEEARRAPREIPAPLVYVNSTGNRVGRPVYTTAELEDMGWKMNYDAITLVLAVHDAASELFTRLKSTGSVGLDPAAARQTRLTVEGVIGLPEAYAIEEQTVERPGGATGAS